MEQTKFAGLIILIISVNFSKPQNPEYKRELNKMESSIQQCDVKRICKKIQKWKFDKKLTHTKKNILQKKLSVTNVKYM